MRTRFPSLAFALTVALSWLAGCSAGSGAVASPGQQGTLSLEVTDAPIDHSMVEQATIWVRTIRIHSPHAGGEGFRTLYDDEPVQLDLLELRNGLKRTLVLADLEAGSYDQLRLVVSRAYLRLSNGAEYDSEDGSLRLTSQGTSGFKVFIEPAVEVVGGLTTSLLLDVDLTKTFKPIPANDPWHANSYHLHPVIRVANLAHTGDLRGLVRRDVGGQLSGVGAATVYVLPPGGVEDDAIATTVTEENGAYAVLGLEPGTYDVLARRTELSGRVDGQVVSVGNATLVDVLVNE